MDYREISMAEAIQEGLTIVDSVDDLGTRIKNVRAVNPKGNKFENLSREALSWGESPEHYAKRATLITRKYSE